MAVAGVRAQVIEGEKLFANLWLLWPDEGLRREGRGEEL